MANYLTAKNRVALKKDLIKALKKDTAINLKQKIDKNKDVSKYIKDTMIKNIQTEVYDSYSPTLYNRRSSNGGLLDPDNISIKTNLIKKNNNYSVSIEIDNITQPSSSVFNTAFREQSPYPLLTDWVEFGLVSPPTSYIDTYMDYGEYTRPRSFMKKTQYDILKDKTLINHILKGLK